MFNIKYYNNKFFNIKYFNIKDFNIGNPKIFIGPAINNISGFNNKFIVSLKLLYSNILFKY